MVTAVAKRPESVVSEEQAVARFRIMDEDGSVLIREESFGHVVGMTFYDTIDYIQAVTRLTLLPTMIPEGEEAVSDGPGLNTRIIEAGRTYECLDP